MALAPGMWALVFLQCSVSRSLLMRPFAAVHCRGRLYVAPLHPPPALRRSGHGVELAAAARTRGPDEQANTASDPLTHTDITWKIRPPTDASDADRARWASDAAAMRDDCERQGAAIPLVWIPPGFPQCLLEAWADYEGEPTKVGRFGLTIAPGPPAPPLLAAAQALFGAAAFPDAAACRAAAVIYMVVEPAWRGRSLGTRALEVVDGLHAAQGATLTVLVADDKDNGRLVRWYEAQGFRVAPQLQDLFGSPNGIYGTTMVRRTGAKKPASNWCIEWW